MRIKDVKTRFLGYDIWYILLFIYFSSERYELDRFLLHGTNNHIVANSTDTRTSEKQSGSKENGITERAKRKEAGKWNYLCKSHRYSILCPLFQPPILYIILQQKHSVEQTGVIENTHAKKAFVTHKSQTRRKKRNHFHDNAVNSQCLQVFSWMLLLLLYRFYKVFFFSLNCYDIW